MKIRKKSTKQMICLLLAMLMAFTPILSIKVLADTPLPEAPTGLIAIPGNG